MIKMVDIERSLGIFFRGVGYKLYVCLCKAPRVQCDAATDEP